MIRHKETFDALLDRIESAQRHGRPYEALTRLQRATLIAPIGMRSQLEWRMGAIYQQVGRTEAARAVYRRAAANGAPAQVIQQALNSLPPEPPALPDFGIGESVKSEDLNVRLKVVDSRYGGFGVVYKCALIDDCEELSLQAGDFVALKSLQGRLLWRDVDRSQFGREAVTWALLRRHPNIVEAFDVDEFEYRSCILMEYVAGGTLADRIGEGRRIDVASVAKFALQICEAMNFAHQTSGLVHGDIKPSNCLVDKNDSLKIADFGLAVAASRSENRRLAQGGALGDPLQFLTTPAGTIPYMAPEQFEPEFLPDIRCDVHAFGVTVYEMLAGDTPYTGHDAQMHINGNSASLPGLLRETILSCVERRPENRPSDFSELRELLLKASGWSVKDAGSSWGQAGVEAELQYAFRTARALHGAEKPAEALQQLFKVTAIPPAKVAAFQKLEGDIWFSAKEFAFALTAYQGWAATIPDSEDAQLAIARVYEAVGSPSLRLHLTRLVGRDNNSYKYLLAAATYLKAGDQFLQALNLLDRATRAPGARAAAHAMMAEVLLELGRQSEAQTVVQNAMEKWPESPELLSVAGARLTRSDPATALQMLDKALLVNPRSAVHWNRIGTTHLRLGELENAADAFERALDIDPLLGSDTSLLVLQATGRGLRGGPGQLHAINELYGDPHTLEGRRGDTARPYDLWPQIPTSRLDTYIDLANYNRFSLPCWTRGVLRIRDQMLIFSARPSNLIQMAAPIADVDNVQLIKRGSGFALSHGGTRFRFRLVGGILFPNLADNPRYGWLPGPGSGFSDSSEAREHQKRTARMWTEIIASSRDGGKDD